jgi:hypothetical protein
MKISEVTVLPINQLSIGSVLNEGVSNFSDSVQMFHYELNNEYLNSIACI